MIKPSSPTPEKLRHFKLSLLDRLVPPSLYINFVLFYSSSSSSSLLRDSLSSTLSHFYPFAGRIRSSESIIDCNDNGIVYLEAEANQTMSNFLLAASPPPATQVLLGRLAPKRPSTTCKRSEEPHDDNDDVPLASVQRTVFQCGGMALGVSLSHVIADGQVFGMFLQEWTARGRSSSSSKYYAHDMAASLFAKSDNVFNLIMSSFVQRVQNATATATATPTSNVVVGQTRLVFNSKAILALKSKVKSTQVPNPSRTLAIQALIWKVAMKAAAATSSSRSSSSIAISLVNLRPRMKTPLPDYSVGNLCWTTVARYDHDHNHDHDHDHDHNHTSALAEVVKKSIDKVDAEYFEKLRGEEGEEVIREWVEEKGSLREYGFSSMVKIGLNRVDFGFGLPVWVGFLGITDNPLADTVFLFESTPNGEDVEAWVSLDEKEIPFFQQDSLLLQYAAVNPPIIIN
ncbi:Stemmadenine O-acetyltransferase [Linum perenne]